MAENPAPDVSQDGAQKVAILNIHHSATKDDIQACLLHFGGELGDKDTLKIMTGKLRDILRHRELTRDEYMDDRFKGWWYMQEGAAEMEKGRHHLEPDEKVFCEGATWVKSRVRDFGAIASTEGILSPRKRKSRDEEDLGDGEGSDDEEGGEGKGMAKKKLCPKVKKKYMKLIYDGASGPQGMGPEAINKHIEKNVEWARGFALTKKQHMKIREKVYKDNWSGSISAQAHDFKLSNFKKNENGLHLVGWEATDPMINDKIITAFTNTARSKKDIESMIETDSSDVVAQALAGFARRFIDVRGQRAIDALARRGFTIGVPEKMDALEELKAKEAMMDEDDDDDMDSDEESDED